MRGARLMHSILFVAVPVSGALGFLLPFALFAACAGFPGMLWGTALYVLAAGEKIWVMFLRMRNIEILKPRPDQRDWTTITVGLSNILVMWGVIIEYYVRRTGFPNPGWVIGGAAVYAVALVIRYRSLALLKLQWAVHVDKPIENRRLIREGPYAWVRHPMYLAAIMEIGAIPLMLGCFVMTAVGLLVFIPAEWGRLRFEEKQMREVFGRPYEDYMAQVWALFPLPFGKRD